MYMGLPYISHRTMRETNLPNIWISRRFPGNFFYHHVLVKTYSFTWLVMRASISFFEIGALPILVFTFKSCLHVIRTFSVFPPTNLAQMDFLYIAIFNTMVFRQWSVLWMAVINISFESTPAPGYVTDVFPVFMHNNENIFLYMLFNSSTKALLGWSSDYKPDNWLYFIRFFLLFHQ